MKKRYRYGDPTSRSFLQRARPFVFMIIGWNAVAYLGWTFLNHQASKDDEGWDSRTSAQKIAILTGSDPGKTKTKRVSLFGSSESSTKGSSESDETRQDSW